MTTRRKRPGSSGLTAAGPPEPAPGREWNHRHRRHRGPRRGRARVRRPGRTARFGRRALRRRNWCGGDCGCGTRTGGWVSTRRRHVAAAMGAWITGGLITGSGTGKWIGGAGTGASGGATTGTGTTGAAGERRESGEPRVAVRRVADSMAWAPPAVSAR